MGWQIILLLHETASRTKPAPRLMTCFQVNGGAGIIVDSVGPQRDAEFKVALMLRDRAQTFALQKLCGFRLYMLTNTLR